MISASEKAQVIAQIKRNKPLSIIAEDHELPIKVVEEWANECSKNPNDLIAIHSNIEAVKDVTSGKVLEIDEDLLEDILIETAMDVAKHVSIPAQQGDPYAAKAVKECADAVSKLYSTFVLKNGSGLPSDAGTQNGLAMFTATMKD